MISMNFEAKSYAELDRLILEAADYINLKTKVQVEVRQPMMVAAPSVPSLVTTPVPQPAPIVEPPSEELDSEGQPWNEAIHSAKKTKTASDRKSVV